MADMKSSNVVCFLAAAAKTSRDPQRALNHTTNCSMKTPENDLFEITLVRDHKPVKVLVRISGQKASQFRVQLCDGEDGQTQVERDLTLIGSEFQHGFNPVSLGNLREWMGAHDPDRVRRLLEAGGINASSLTLARAMHIMDKQAVDAEEALRKARLVNDFCRDWLAAVNHAAFHARELAASKSS
jgi:hypothetical protein